MVSHARLGIEISRSPPAPSLRVSLKFIGARSFFWLQRLLIAMLLARYRHFDYSYPVGPAPLVRRLEPASSADLLRQPSLVISCRASSFLSEFGRADLKQSGLLNLVPSSATQNLAYLPCRMASHGSTFRFFAGGGAAKKVFPPARFPKLGFPHDTAGRFAATSQTSYQGALLCGLKTITELQSCFRPSLVSFSRRHLNGPQTASLVLRPKIDRRSSPMLH